MEGENTALFDMVEERTESDGFKVRVWKGAGYTLVWRQYSSTGIDIRITPNEGASKFCPCIYVVCDDDDGHPIKTIISTTSYGSLPVSDYKEFLRALENAALAAESIEAQFIRNSKQ